MGILIIGLIMFIIICVFVMIFILVHKNARRSEYLYQINQENIKRQEHAVWGGATVINVSAGIVGEGSTKARVNLTFEVTQQGGLPYRTSATWLVDISALGFIQQGQQISVKIDAENPKIIYPNSPGAIYVHS